MKPASLNFLIVVLGLAGGFYFRGMLSSGRGPSLDKANSGKDAVFAAGDVAPATGNPPGAPVAGGKSQVVAGRSPMDAGLLSISGVLKSEVRERMALLRRSGMSPAAVRAWVVDFWKAQALSPGLGAEDFQKLSLQQGKDGLVNLSAFLEVAGAGEAGKTAAMLDQLPAWKKAAVLPELAVSLAWEFPETAARLAMDAALTDRTKVLQDVYEVWGQTDAAAALAHAEKLEPGLLRDRMKGIINWGSLMEDPVALVSKLGTEEEFVPPSMPTDGASIYTERWEQALEQVMNQLARHDSSGTDTLKLLNAVGGREAWWQQGFAGLAAVDYGAATRLAEAVIKDQGLDEESRSGALRGLADAAGANHDLSWLAKLEEAGMDSWDGKVDFIQSWMAATADPKALPRVFFENESLSDQALDVWAESKIQDDILSSLQEIPEELRGNALMRLVIDRGGMDAEGSAEALRSLCVAGNIWVDGPLHEVFATWMTFDPVKALAWAGAHAESFPEAKVAALSETFDPPAAAKMLDALSPGLERDRFIAHIAGRMVYSDPEAAVVWALSANDAEARGRALEEVAGRISSNELTLEKIPLPEDMSQADRQALLAAYEKAQARKSTDR